MKQNRKQLSRVNGARKRGRLLLISCVLAGLFISIGIYMLTDKLLGRSEPMASPKEVWSHYVMDLNTRDYIGMYALLSTASKERVTEEQFTSRNRNIYEGIEASELTITVTEVVDEEERKVVRYNTEMETAAGELSFSNKVSLTKDIDNEYRIDWNSSVIFPNLTDEDTVRITTIRGTRGRIVDRNGLMLAGQGNVSSVGLVPGKMAEQAEEDIASIAEILGVPVELMKKKLQAPYVKEDTFVPIQKISKYDETGRVKEEQLLKIPGVMITNVEERIYPLGKAAAHLTGYVQGINAEELASRKGQGYSDNSVLGKSGLEKLFEDRIRGINGCEIMIVDENGKSKESLAVKRETHGETIQLTIDAELQLQLYNELQEDKSSSVVMNPKTGEIAALVSTPAYDPNDFVIGMLQSEWQAINEDLNKPMYNRFKAALVPGSSFKPIIAAIGLTTNKLIADENIGRSGRSWQKDAGWGGYYVTTLKDYGDQANMRNAMVYSDNIYFAKAALRIGPEVLSEELTKLGFREEMPFSFGLSPSQFGDSDTLLNEIMLADSGYGQGNMVVNPVHMASMYSAFVNDGSMVEPYLEYREDTRPEYWKQQVFTKEAVDLVRNAMIEVVSSPDGTGRGARIEGVTLAAKTGTAELKASKADTTGTELGWFNGFIVSDDPSNQRMIVSMVEDVKERGGSGYVISKVKSLFQP